MSDETTFRIDPQAARPVTVLVVLQDHATTSHALPSAGRVVLGRADDCDVRIDDITISRQHAAIDVGETIELRDLGSANGTRIAGRALRPGETCRITPGDVLEIGNVLVVVQARSTALVAPSAQRSTRSPGQRPRPTARAQTAVVEDPAMERVYQLVEWVADSPLSVLILGETGSGKEIVAGTIHAWSPRADGPFVKINCGAISPSLIESELFGYEKGAFTGATQPKSGLIESAHGGTLFLDEVGEIPISLQVKLLRVLEEHMVLRVGSLRPKSVDLRVVAATHRDLRAEIGRGTFREDLFFRLNGVTINVPPLRERVNEIEPLARLFATEVLSRKTPAEPIGFTPAALAALRAYRWPGNVRELKNAVERAAVVARGREIDVAHLPDEVAGAGAGIESSRPRGVSTPVVQAAPIGDSTLRDQMVALEKQRIVEALEKCEGNQTRAAELLGMPRRTLVKRLGEYGIRRKGEG